MACARFEPLVALHVGGELVAPEVEAHLRTCAECRGFAEELKRSQAALRSLREEEAPAAALAEVRGRVLDEIASRKPSWWFALRWHYALAPAAAAVALVVALSPRPPVLNLPAPAIAKSKRASVRVRDINVDAARRRTRWHGGPRQDGSPTPPAGVA